tara:strand:+ start:366 stop:575 length:210 start_codon:yes stop_codon:yes gene_type:complete
MRPDDFAELEKLVLEARIERLRKAATAGPVDIGDIARANSVVAALNAAAAPVLTVDEYYAGDPSCKELF